VVKYSRNKTESPSHQNHVGATRERPSRRDVASQIERSARSLTSTVDHGI